MLALSLKQPWAECLVNGSKSIEIRTWAPPRDVCDLILAAWEYPEEKQAPLFAIHAGMRPDVDAPHEIWEKVYEIYDPPRQGGIVGLARLVGWHWYRTDIGHDGEAYRGRRQYVLEQPLHLNPLSWWREGLCAWVFAEQRRLETMVPLRGQLGVWELPEAVARAVEADDPAVG